MISVWIYTIISILVISLVSFVGVFTMGINSEKMKKILIYLISFSAGALFGDAFIHLFPEIISEWGFTLEISVYLLFGILIFFILEKVVHFQQYHCHGDECCEHELEESPHKSHKKHVHSFAFMSLIGSSLHNFIDGTLIAASYLVSLQLGIATSLAVFLHEIPHELGDFSILVHGGFERSRALFVNFISALVSIIGAVFTFLLSSYIPNLQMILVPIATGGFIYVAGSDLIPELHKVGGLKTSIIQVLTFILGILVMASLLLLE